MQHAAGGDAPSARRLSARHATRFRDPHAERHGAIPRDSSPTHPPPRERRHRAGRAGRRRTRPRRTTAGAGGEQVETGNGRPRMDVQHAAERGRFDTAARHPEPSDRMALRVDREVDEVTPHVVEHREPAVVHVHGQAQGPRSVAEVGRHDRRQPPAAGLFARGAGGRQPTRHDRAERPDAVGRRRRRRGVRGDGHTVERRKDGPLHIPSQRRLVGSRALQRLGERLSRTSSGRLAREPRGERLQPAHAIRRIVTGRPRSQDRRDETIGEGDDLLPHGITAGGDQLHEPAGDPAILLDRQPGVAGVAYECGIGRLGRAKREQLAHRRPRGRHVTGLHEALDRRADRGAGCRRWIALGRHVGSQGIPPGRGGRPEIATQAEHHGVGQRARRQADGGVARGSPNLRESRRDVTPLQIDLPLPFERPSRAGVRGPRRLDAGLERGGLVEHVERIDAA